MEMLLTFMAGTVFGCVFIMCYCYYKINKIKKVKEDLLSKIKTKATELNKKESSIKDRLVKASAIAQTQMAIRAQLEMPSKNSLDSKYKNGLVSELQDLEQHKLDLLRTVLAEGFDPLITVINESGNKTEVPLSAYVNEAAGVLNTHQGSAAPATTPQNDTDQPKKTSKFVLHKGGKDDNGTTH